MGLINVGARYRAHLEGVKHCTFNPEGPGVVRIHLIPPKFNFFVSKPYIAILNGYYILPIGNSWAILLSAFIDEVNLFSGRPINESERKAIILRTIRKTKKAYPFLDGRMIENDLEEMTGILFDIAKGRGTDAYIEKMSIRSYSDSMKAPHRMDLIICAMTNENGTWKCNQRCMFCYAGGQKLSSSKELSTQEWKKVIDKLRRVGVPMVTFTGGEPTLRSDLAELVEYSKWFVTRLNTNGVELTKQLCKELRLASLDSVQITLYSHDEAVHDKLTGSDRFNDTVQGIRNAVESGLDVSVNTPICSINSDYDKTLDFIKNLGVRYVTCSGLICTGSAEKNHREFDIDEESLFAILKKAKNFCDAHAMEIDFTSPGLIKKEKLESIGINVPSCGAALSNMAIAPDGTVIPCQSWLSGDFRLGNILTDDFSKCWKNEKCDALRKMTDDEALCCPFRKGGESD